MIKLEKLEKGEFFEDAFLVSYRYNKDYLNKMRSLKYKRYVPDKKAWEIPSSELKHLVDLFGVDDINVNAKYLEGLVEKEESKAEETPEDIKERLKDIKPIVDYPFKTKPFPHQIEAFNRGYECKDLLLADDQGLGKTKESIDIAVARKGEIGKCLIVCGVNSVKYNWKKEVSVHSNESCVVIDGKTVDKRIQQIDQWIYGSPYFGIINIESLRNEKIMDRIYMDCKDDIILYNLLSILSTPVFIAVWLSVRSRDQSILPGFFPLLTCFIPELYSLSRYSTELRYFCSCIVDYSIDNFHSSVLLNDLFLFLIYPSLA